MTVTFANPAMRDGLANIRRECFFEDDAYMDFFFDRRFVPGNTVVCVEQGRVVASLYLLPVTIATPERQFSAMYVYAVGTLPDFRRRGFAGELLKYAETVMPGRGVEALLLAPASEELVDYYAKFGYRPCFYRKVIQDPAKYGFSPSNGFPAELQTKTLRGANFVRLRDAAYAPSGYFVRWDAAALDYAVQECLETGGLAYYLWTSAEEGFFLASPEYGGVAVKESMLPEQLLPHALQIIKLHFGQNKPVTFYQAVRAPAGDWTAGRGETEHFAMLKCLNLSAGPAATATPYFGLALD